MRLSLGLLALACLVAVSPAAPSSPRRRPPLCPRWALRPWVWDDRGSDSRFAPDAQNAHHTAAVLDLVDGYRRRGIPVGAVILDSPWATNYNSLSFDTRRYANPRKLIGELHDRGVRVVLWMTAIMNPGDRAFPNEGDFREALDRGYLILGAGRELQHWWKGRGGLIDFFNPRAVRWWHGLMDRALDLGIDGWKVDKVEASLPAAEEERVPETEDATVRRYRQRYFRDTYRYLIHRRPEGVVIQRPFYANTVADTPAAWAGDQTHSWRGLRSALRLVLGGARTGNAVVGSDIGGYRGGRRPNKELYLRWAQFGALCPLMETGGAGERRPWMIDEETVRIYRHYATLHTELIPYLYTWMVENHLTGHTLLRPLGADRGEYLLGPDLFVSVVMRPGTAKVVHLPPGEWIDYWDPSKSYRGPARLASYPAPLERLPLFVRRGAILPLEPGASPAWGQPPADEGTTARPAEEVIGRRENAATRRLMLAIYPRGLSSLRYRYETGPQAFGEGAVQVSERTAEVEIGWRDVGEPVLLRVHGDRRPSAVCGRERASTSDELSSAEDRPLAEKPTRAALDAAEAGWCWDPATRIVWVKPVPEESGAVVIR